MKHFLCATAFLVAASMPHGLAQDRIYSVEGLIPGGAFGGELVAATDLDRDGVEDLVVAAPRADGFQGTLCALSGASGRRIWMAAGQHPGDSFGHALSFVGDVNQDGVPDLVVGAPDYDVGPAMDCGAWYVLSGRDGAVLFRKEGSAYGGRMGVSIAGAGDVASNGTPYVAVGWGGLKYLDVYRCNDGFLHYRNQGTVDGYATHLTDLSALQSGPIVCTTFGFTPSPSGQTVRSSGGALQTGLPGTRMVPLNADIDGDGYLDLLSSGPEFAAPFGGVVWLLRYRPPPINPPWGAILVTRTLNVSINSNQTGVGTCLAPAGDVDLDGIVDFLVGCSQSTLNGPRSGHLDCYSGRTQQLIFRLLGRPYDELASACAKLGDVNGDGVPDFVVGAPGATGGRTFTGRVDVISGRALRLRGDVTEVSVAQGGVQHLVLDLGSSWSGSAYLLLGTVTGTQPGVMLQGINVPLNFDPYTFFTSSAANGSFLQNTLGTLDQQGRAQCTIQVPPSVAPSGLAVHHACLWFDSSLTVRGATGTVPLRLVP